MSERPTKSSGLRNEGLHARPETEQTHKFALILTGYPFAGKSTLGRAIARETGSDLVAIHKIRHSKRLNLDGSPMSPDQFTALREEADRQIADSLDHGHNVVIDTTPFTREARDRLRRLASTHGAIPILIHLDTTEEEVRRRFQRQSVHPDPQRLVPVHHINFEEVIAGFEAPDYDEKMNGYLRFRPGDSTYNLINKEIRPMLGLPEVKAGDRTEHLRRILHPDFEAVQDSPAFLQRLLTLINDHSVVEDNVRVVHMDRVLRHKDNVLQTTGGLIVTAKSFSDLKRLDTQVHAVTANQAAYGSSYGAPKDKGGFAAIPAEVLLDNRGIDVEDMKEHAVLGENDLVGPHDWVTDGEFVHVLTEGSIMTMNLHTGTITSFESPLIQDSHYVSQMNDGKLVLTSTGTDQLIIYDSVENEIISQVSAWDMGMQTAIGLSDRAGKPLKRINAFSDQELPDDLQTLVDEHEFVVFRYPRGGEFAGNGLITSQQSAHFNSVIHHPAGPLLTTVFATSQFDTATGKRIEQQGSGGKVLAVAEEGAKEIVSGLTNPHSLRFIGNDSNTNYFMLANSGEGRLQVFGENIDQPLEWNLVGELAFDSLPEDKFRPTNWLQDATPSATLDGGNPYLTVTDASRRGVYVIDMNTFDYQFINTGNQAVLKRAVYIPA